MRIRIWRVLTVAAVALAALQLGSPAAPARAQGAWYAEYFANRYLAGGPALTRYDDGLHFKWGIGSPGRGIPADDFSARWTHEEWFDGGTYRFSYRSDDGLRIWVGDRLVVDDWRDRQAVWTFVDRFIPGGTHRVRVEYYEHIGGAMVQAAWERVSGGEVWRAEYFANRSLDGKPALVRYDPAIDFDWGYGRPDGAVPADNFSVRWTHSVGFNPGTYRFYASCDDGVRVYVDGHRVVDVWQDQKLPNTYSGDLTLGTGLHTVTIEYYEHGGEASAHVWWNRLGGFSGWEGRYYDNAELRGGPALIRDDADISFDWGAGAPAEWIPSDNFSVVWSRSVTFTPGYYRFNTRSDDGVRVWLDGGLVIDFWRPMDYEWHYVDGVYLAGTHAIKVEYFERGGRARIQFWWEPSGAAPSPPEPTPAGTVIVDDADPGFVTAGLAAGWRTVPEGYNGRLTWTRNNYGIVAGYNWARWYPSLQARRYEVFVYIPERYTTTSHARYWIHHAGGYTLRVVDQSTSGSRWVSLGTYSFLGTSADHVTLSDVTYEPRVSRLIAFDAARWEPR